MNDLLKLESSEIINDIEKKIISAILQNVKNIDDIFLRLVSSDFGNPIHKSIFEIALMFRGDGKILDYEMLLSFIETNKEYQFENFYSYLAEIDSIHPNNLSINQYIDQIKNQSIKRQLSNFSSELENTNLDVITAQETLSGLEQKFLDIVSSKKNKEMERLSDILNDFKTKLEEVIFKKTNEMTGTPSGINTLDNITNGFQPGDLIILAARPGIGKTALAINFMKNAAKIFRDERKSGKDIASKEKAVVMFSLEMGKDQICQRILAADSAVELNVNKFKVWTDREKTSLRSAVTELMDIPIYIDDSSDQTIIDIQSKIKQMSADKDIKLVVIDYLQLLKISKTNKNGLNRQQEVAEISRTLKKIARQFMVPIIAIAQLSRKVEERRGDQKRPILSDLRESGSIEQDADMVCFLNYAELSDEQKNELQIENSVVVEFIIAKNRNGETTIVYLEFNKPFSRYNDLDYKG